MKKKNSNKNKYYYFEYKSLIERIKKKLITYNSKNYKPDYDTSTYFASYYNGQGLSFIKKSLGVKNNIFTSLPSILKDFIYSSNYNEIKLINNNKKILSNKIIFTWGYKRNFQKNGSLQDNYFNINSRQSPNAHWVVLFLDQHLPSKIDNNVTLIHIANRKKINLLLMLKILISNLKYLIFDQQYFLFSISSHNFLSKKILKMCKQIVNKSTKSVLFTYEAQPFQNKIIQFLKSKKIKTLGYIHSPPLALPTNFVKKKYSPTKIFVNGIDQKRCFTKLGWKKKEIKIIPSTRFLNIKKNFSKQIFFPISIKSISEILKNLEYLIVNLKLDINQYKIRNHPAAENSSIHRNLKFKIDDLKKKYNRYSFKKSELKNFSIFIGSSGSIIEALERGCRVIQIAEVPILDFYSNYFWESIIVKKVNNNIFTYSLSKKKNLIHLGNKPKNLNMFFKNSDI